MKEANKSSSKSRKQAPGRTIEERENQMISLAVDLAEKQLKEGTASSQVIAHYLKLGSSRALLERERLEKENELLKAKTESLKSQKATEELYRNAIRAMRHYSGNDSADEEIIDD